MSEPNRTAAELLRDNEAMYERMLRELGYEAIRWARGSSSDGELKRQVFNLLEVENYNAGLRAAVHWDQEP